MLYYFKEVFYDDRRFIVYRHELNNALGVFMSDINKNEELELLKFVYNTKEIRDVIKNYKNYASKYSYNLSYFDYKLSSEEN